MDKENMMKEEVFTESCELYQKLVEKYGDDLKSLNSINNILMATIGTLMWNEVEVENMPEFIKLEIETLKQNLESTYITKKYKK